jgi:hypothetical protein
MKANHAFRTACVGTLCASLILGHWPRAASAASPTTPVGSPPVSQSIVDVALSAEGRLSGMVVDGQNRPLAGARVMVLDSNRHETVTYTDVEGRFAFMVPRGGVYVLDAGAGGLVCRVWTRGSAPPHAQPLVSMRVAETVIRGQSSPVYQWISEYPFLFYAGLATAITVPLVVATSNHDRRPASP